MNTTLDHRPAVTAATEHRTVPGAADEAAIRELFQDLLAA